MRSTNRRQFLSASTAGVAAATASVSLPMVHAAGSDVCARLRPAGAGAAYDALQERLRRHLGAMLERESRLGSGLVPTHFECAMEDDALVAPAAPGVTVTGTVDRLDLSPAGAVLVIDYKRTGSDFSATSDDVVRRLQLPLYGRMARRALGPPSREAGGVVPPRSTPGPTPGCTELDEREPRNLRGRAAGHSADRLVAMPHRHTAARARQHVRPLDGSRSPRVPSQGLRPGRVVGC